jgi:hypothetical protein
MAQYGGMTVNERLIISGLTGAFDDAARGRDRDQMIEILGKVEMTPDAAAKAADMVLANPARYGL